MTKMQKAAKKAWKTRRLNALKAKYNAAKSPGVKAAIKRKMNQL